MNGEPLQTVQPRRPERAALAGDPLQPEWRARAASLPNLFADLFPADGLSAPTDPISRSRSRIAAATVAREAAESPELVNLWHDGFDAPSAPEARAANDQPAASPCDDERLMRVRAALYDPVEGCDDPAPSVQMRLAVHAMNGTLIAVAAPVGAAVMTYSLLRGEDLRLTARALTLCGALMTMLNLGFPLV